MPLAPKHAASSEQHTHQYTNPLKMSQEDDIKGQLPAKVLGMCAAQVLSCHDCLVHKTVCRFLQQHKDAYLDIQIFARPEVHDMYVEVIVSSLRKQLAQSEDLWCDIQDRLLAGAAY